MESDSACEAFEDGNLVDVDIEALRHEFRRLRTARRLSQSDVANLLGVSQATISAFEQGSYPTMRKKSLRGVLKLVQFWRGESDRVVQGDFASRQMVGIPSSPPREELPPTECPNCHAQIPRHDPPFPFCPFCKATIGLVCPCGNVIRDDLTNFCSRCGRCILGQGDKPHQYPLLDKARGERLRLALLRAFLASLEAGNATTEALMAELEALVHERTGESSGLS